MYDLALLNAARAFALVCFAVAGQDFALPLTSARCERLRGSAKVYSRAQSGDAHGYLRMVAIGFVLLVLAAVMGGVR